MGVRFTINRTKALKDFFCLLVLFFGIILWGLGIKLQIYFSVAIIFVFIILMPEYIFNPKTVIFFYYFTWYVAAPMFANRYKDLYSKNHVDTAYIMFLSVYIAAMVTVDLFTNDTVNIIKIDGLKKNYKIIKYLFLLIGIIGLAVFISKTGGLELWLSNPYAAFFSRRHSGQYYLLFEYGFLLYLFLEGARGRKVTHPVMIFALLVCLGGCYFIGSKSVAFVMILMLYSYWTNKVKMISLNTVLLGVIGSSVFAIGMYVRQGELMTSLSNTMSTLLNYFDTFDEYLIILNDFKPSLFKTCFMPFNWIGSKFGLVSEGAFHDMSIWLTNIYYPESWLSGGTHQWPIEADLYFNYFFVFGFPVLMLYFWAIARVYELAQKEGGIWMFIYINEWFNIIGHLRGGIFLHIYWYLIPLYIFLFLIDKYCLKKITIEKIKYNVKSRRRKYEIL